MQEASVRSRSQMNTEGTQLIDGGIVLEYNSKLDVQCKQRVVGKKTENKMKYNGARWRRGLDSEDGGGEGLR